MLSVLRLRGAWLRVSAFSPGLHGVGAKQLLVTQRQGTCTWWNSPQQEATLWSQQGFDAAAPLDSQTDDPVHICQEYLSTYLSSNKTTLHKLQDGNVAIIVRAGGAARAAALRNALGGGLGQVTGHDWITQKEDECLELLVFVCKATSGDKHTEAERLHQHLLARRAEQTG